LLKSYIDKPVGASLSLALCYLPYGIGSGIGGSLRASPSSSLPGSLGIRLRGRLLVSIWGRMGGSIGDRLRGRLGSSLRVSLWGSLEGRLGGSDLFNDEELSDLGSKLQEVDARIYSF